MEHLVCAEAEGAGILWLSSRAWCKWWWTREEAAAECAVALALSLEEEQVPLLGSPPRSESGPNGFSIGAHLSESELVYKNPKTSKIHNIKNTQDKRRLRVHKRPPKTLRSHKSKSTSLSNLLSLYNIYSLLWKILTSAHLIVTFEPF
jgi:hypothetical protein